MKRIHNIEISVFAREEENNLDSVREKLIELVGVDPEKEKIAFEESNDLGAKDNKIEILKIRLEKERNVNKFISDMIYKFNDEQKEMIMNQLDSRVDDKCNFFIRLDREKLLGGEYWITDSGDCFHIKILVAAYPAKKEKAIEILKSLF